MTGWWRSREPSSDFGPVPGSSTANAPRENQLTLCGVSHIWMQSHTVKIHGFLWFSLLFLIFGAPRGGPETSKTKKNKEIQRKTKKNKEIQRKTKNASDTGHFEKFRENSKISRKNEKFKKKQQFHEKITISTKHRTIFEK